MTIFFRRRFLAALAAVLAGSSQVAFAVPVADHDLDPAMWVVRDADTTIYLFGSVHALDAKSAWFNDEIKTAFDASQELVLEVLTPENPAELAPLMGKYAMDPSGRTLTSKLSPTYQEKLAATLKAHGMPAKSLDQYNPFFAAIVLSALDFNKAGMTAESGVEAVLKAEASRQKKGVGAVETMEKQMSFFAALDEPNQIALLEQSLDDAGDKVRKDLGKLIAYWGRGDVDQVAAEMRMTEARSPELYKLLIVDRNRVWAGWIDDRLDRPGIVFMAVGAGHLGGPDSVQRFLKKRGIKSKRLKAGYRVQ